MPVVQLGGGGAEGRAAAELDPAGGDADPSVRRLVVQRSCDACGEPYEAKTSRSRFHNANCRLRYSRGVRPPAGLKVAEVPPDPSPLSTTLVGATHRQLEEAGRLETWLGQQALAVAEILASGRGTPAGLAAASRELRETMTAALRGADAPSSAVMRHRDELAARRARAGA